MNHLKNDMKNSAHLICVPEEILTGLLQNNSQKNQSLSEISRLRKGEKM
jgi:hypothetical protein